MPHTDFARAFSPGLRIARPSEVLELEVVELGTLDITAAGLWLFDPGFEAVAAPRTELTPGRYRADLGVVTASSGSRARRLTTALRLLAPGAEVREWRDVGTVACDTGCIAISTRAPTPRGALEAEWDMAPGLVRCKAGFGDGGYGCFVGLDVRGVAVALAVDFFVLVGPDEVHLALPPDARGRIDDARLADAGLQLTSTDLGYALDATGRVSPEVTDFALMVFDALGAPLWVAGSSQGLHWSWDRPHPSMKRIELWFQRAVIAY